MATFVYPYTQYGGVWNLTSQSQAQGQTTWPTPPAPHLYAWGANTYGELGQGNITNYSSPKQVGSLTNWFQISAFSLGGSIVAIKTDGTLWAWGWNNLGQLGLGNTTNYSSPKQVGALTNWSQVSTGKYHTLAIKTDGTLWSWGSNHNGANTVGFGQLGLGNTTNYSSPKQVGSLTTWLSVAGGSYHSIAVKTDGTLWAWGFNQYGQLGIGNRTNYSSPVQVGSLTNWSSKIYNNPYNSLAIKSDGTLWTWGNNGSGQLGQNNTTNYSSPKQVGALTNWLNVSAGYSNSLSTKTDGTLWTWGYNNQGQLGFSNIVNYSSPKQVGSLTNWLNVAGGLYDSYSIKTDGTLWAWGINGSGQLGLGNTTSYSSPKQVGSLTSWISIAAGGYYVSGIAKF